VQSYSYKNEGIKKALKHTCCPSKIFVIQLLLVLLVTSCTPSDKALEEALPILEPTIDDPFSSIELEQDLASDPVQMEESNATSENVLWVDNTIGDDLNSGLSPVDPFSSIQKALDVSYPGVFIRIAPGVYRETLTFTVNGTPDQPITILSDEGPGSVIIRGSESSSTLNWLRITENTFGFPESVNLSEIYTTDLSSWNLKAPPRFIVGLDPAENIETRYLPAREPDYHVEAEWRFHEFWWAAEGGHQIASCNPAKNINPECDLPDRSYTELTDTADDTEPDGVESGNLTSFGNLEGASLVVLDARHAHYIYRRTIISSDDSTGTIVVDEDCEDEGKPGLGWGSKYYLENHPALLDQPGEWWYDKNSGMLYFWSPNGENPENLKLEISRWDHGFETSNISNIVIDGLQIELFNNNGYQIINKTVTSASHNNKILNSKIWFTNKGVVLIQYVSGDDDQKAIIGFQIENCSLSYMDTSAVDSYLSWPGIPSPENFTYSGIRNIQIRNNNIHHIGFNTTERSAVGVRFFYPDQIVFEGNHLHHVAQNGMHLHLSLIDSNQTYDLETSEIKLGEILIKDNLFEKACMATSDCGGLKFGGSSRPYSHIFREVLVVGNTFRHNFGWSYVSILRNKNVYGDGNGFYMDYAAGIHLFRNLAYNNTGAGFKFSCLWRDGDTILSNNVAAGNYLFGISATGKGECDIHFGSVNTQIVNNVLSNNGRAGLEISSANNQGFGNLIIDHNLYFQNGWDKKVNGSNMNILLYIEGQSTSKLRKLSEIQERFAWEDHGMLTDPLIADFSLENLAPYQYFNWDFQPLSTNSPVMDAGTSAQPSTLTNLLNKFEIQDAYCGTAYDIGPYEFCD